MLNRALTPPQLFRTSGKEGTSDQQHVLGPKIILERGCEREASRQVEAEVVSNSRNKLHHTSYKYYFRAQYIEGE